MFSILEILRNKQKSMTNEKDISKFEKKSQKLQNVNNFSGALNVFSCYNYKQQLRLVRNGVCNIIGHKLTNLMIVYCN